MLVELTISNIALIESLRIDFAQGFNVLTGETGSGKSIVVDSLNLALGGRADRDLIRNGADRARVDALFDISGNEGALAFACEKGIQAEDGLVNVTRELTRTGRNICRLAGTVYPLNVLREFTGYLIDVHGQHEHQALMDPKRHIAFLDGFADAAQLEQMKRVRELHAQKTELAATIRKLMKDTAERERLCDVLRFQLQEIESARLKDGEEEKLLAKLQVLENAEKVRGAIDSAYALTYDGAGQMSAQEALLQAANQMQSIASYDKRYAELSEALRSAYYTVRELGGEILDLRDGLEADPVLMDKIGVRLDLIDKLERKYGGTVAEILRFGKDCRSRLEELDSSDTRLEELKASYKRVDAELRNSCDALSASRHELAGRLERDILAQLSDLGMKRAQFEVHFTRLEKPSADGWEEIEFLISANPGEPLKPLANVASGGELSRIMLALKVIAMDHDGIDSMVFDEIDTGVSGRMAQVVGEKMLTIGTRKQVLCVTHLPQIAVLAHNQLRVEKNIVGERTLTDVVTLDGEGRVHEIARLVGNAVENESSLAHARNMLDEAAAMRNELAKMLK